MPRGRKRPARSQKRVESRRTSRHNDRRNRRNGRNVPQSASSRSSSPDSDWSSSRERRESKRRREIAKRSRATEPLKRNTAPRKSLKKKAPKKKPVPVPVPVSSGEPSGDERDEQNHESVQEQQHTDDHVPATASQGPSTSDQPGPSCSPPTEDTSSEATVPCCIPRCTWRGLADAVPNHVEEEHAGMILCGPIQEFHVPVCDPQRGAALSRVVRAFGEMFAVHFRRPPKSNEVLGCVQLLGPPERACDFVYQMEVGDDNGEVPESLLRHWPFVANTSSSREFEIAETLKQVCTAEQADANSEDEPNWGNRQAITVQVKISTTPDCDDNDPDAAASDPPTELAFMWM